MKILYITANPKNINDSHSLSVGEAFLKEYKKNNPEDEVVTIDLFKSNVPLIDNDVMNAWGKLGNGVEFKDLSEIEIEKVSAMGLNLEEFISADKYVFVSPLWNFGVPPVLKAYIDNILITGKTFKYTETGPVGLLENKKALYIQASGGVYSNPQMASYEHGFNHLKIALGFIGISDLQNLLVEGVNMASDGGTEIRSQFISKAIELGKTF